MTDGYKSILAYSSALYSIQITPNTDVLPHVTQSFVALLIKDNTVYDYGTISLMSYS